MDKLINSAIRFACDEDGSQVVEYALIIALVSIVLALALNSAVSGLASTFANLAGTVLTCLTTSTC